MSNMPTRRAVFLDGKPQNLEAAALDALEWLEWLQGFLKLSTRSNRKHDGSFSGMWGNAQDRLAACIEALREFLPAEPPEMRENGEEYAPET